eukprot:1159228-Pelagomonas_calceolata.AAC.10
MAAAFPDKGESCTRDACSLLQTAASVAATETEGLPFAQPQQGLPAAPSSLLQPPWLQLRHQGLQFASPEHKGRPGAALHPSRVPQKVDAHTSKASKPPGQGKCGMGVACGIKHSTRTRPSNFHKSSTL